MKTPKLQTRSLLGLVIFSFSLIIIHPREARTRTQDNQLQLVCQKVNNSCDGPFIVSVCKQREQPLRKVAHGRRCSHDEACVISNSVCFNGICLCQLGLYFSGTQKACLRECALYGNKMDIYKGAGIKGYNDKKLRYATFARCSRLCARQRGFLCLTIEWKADRICHLSHMGYLDVEEKHRNLGSATWILGQRQCK